MESFNNINCNINGTASSLSINNNTMDITNTFNSTIPNTDKSFLDLQKEVELLEYQIQKVSMSQSIFTDKLSEKTQQNEKKYIIEENLSFHHEEERNLFRKKLDLVFDKECYCLLGINKLNEYKGLSQEEELHALSVIEEISKEHGATWKISQSFIGTKGKVLEIFMEKDKNNKGKKPEIRIGLFGPESSGKSTLIGVLVNGVLDDGNGLARSNIFRFQHENNTGKTRNLSHYVSFLLNKIIGYNKDGALINSEKIRIKINGETQDNKSRIFWEEMIHYSDKILSFYDAGGNSKISRYLDYFFLIINPTTGINDTTKRLLKIAALSNITPVSIITNSDSMSNEDIILFINNYKSFLKTTKLKKLPLLVTSSKDAALFSSNIDEAIHPILTISSKTGFGIDILTTFLSLLQKPSVFQTNKTLGNINTGMMSNKESLVYDIHEHFVNYDKKIIVAGFINKGKISVGQKLFLGPDKTGKFCIVEVEGLHCKKVPSKTAYAGQFTTVCIKSKKKNLFFSEDGLLNDQIRKGMVLIDIASKPKSVMTFEVKITSLEEQDRFIKYKYEPLVTIGRIRQCCRIKPYNDDQDNPTKRKEKKRNKKSGVFDEPLSVPPVDDFLEDDEEFKSLYEKELSIFGDQSEKNELLKSSISTTNTSLVGKQSKHKLFDDEYKHLKNNKNNDGFVLPKESFVSLRLQFKNFCEFLEIGDSVIINEPYMRAYGSIMSLETHT